MCGCYHAVRLTLIIVVSSNITLETYQDFLNKKICFYAFQNEITKAYFRVNSISLKVTPTTFRLKLKNLPKCTKFCSARKLEVAAKSFDFLTKNRLMHWQIRGLKGSISGNFCVVCFNL